jgi:dTDP-4-amino-4,6-dideoxygalactose transaminase
MPVPLLPDPIPHRAFSPLVRSSWVLRRWLTDSDARSNAVRKFEEAVASRLGVPHVIATSSGRVALRAILEALDLERGSPIWLPVNTYDGLLPAVAASGLSPRFADIAADYNLDPEDLDHRIAREGAGGVLVATHMFGLPCRLEALSNTCSRQGLVMVEDCAHAFGTEAGGRTAGVTGIAGILSFQARKSINTLGGGAVVTRDDALASKVRSMIDRNRRKGARALLQLATYSIERNLLFAAPGYVATHMIFENRGLFEGARSSYGSLVGLGRGDTMGLSPLQAMLGLAQVDAWDVRKARLDRIWAAYDAAIGNDGLVERPPRQKETGHGRYMYVVRVPDPAGMADRLWKEGIGTARGSPLVPCLDPAGIDSYPGVRDGVAHALQIPFADGLNDRQVERVADALRRLSRG